MTFEKSNLSSWINKINIASCIHNHACICAYKLSYSSSWNIGFSTSWTYNTQLRKKKTNR